MQVKCLDYEFRLICASNYLSNVEAIIKFVMRHILKIESSDNNTVIAGAVYSMSIILRTEANINYNHLPYSKHVHTIVPFNERI